MGAVKLIKFVLPSMSDSTELFKRRDVASESVGETELESSKFESLLNKSVFARLALVVPLRLRKSTYPHM